jgi:hypothetical protein
LWWSTGADYLNIIIQKVKSIIQDFRMFGPKAFLFSIIILSLLTWMILMPLASATPGTFYAKAQLSRTSVYGTGAYMQVITNTIISDGIGINRMAVAFLPDGAWIAMGYLQMSGLNNKAPTYYCEWYIPPSGETYFGVAPNGQWHTFAVQYGRGTTYDWLGLLDGTAIYEKTGYHYDHSSSVYTEGESHNTQNYMTENVDNMQYALLSGRYSMAWYNWDGYAGVPWANPPYYISWTDNTHVDWWGGGS